MEQQKYTVGDGPKYTMIFFRGGHFYPIQGVMEKPLKDQAEEQAECNPGTIRVEDIYGNILWSSVKVT